MSLHGGRALFVVAAATLATPGDAVGADARLTAVHVTQGIQTVTGNAVPLVADRATAIRAVIDETGGNISGVTGRAHVTVDGVRVTPPEGIRPITEPAATFDPVAAPSLDVETDTMNFELLAPTGIVPRDDPVTSTNVTVRVDITAPGDTDASNNSRTVSGLRVEAKRTPVIRFRRTSYLPFSPTAAPSATYVAPGRGDAYFRGVMPVDDSDPNLYAETGGLVAWDLKLDCIPFTDCTADPTRIDAAAVKGPPEGDLRLLNNATDRMVLAAGSGVDGEFMFLYDWTPPDSTANHSGLGMQGVGVAYGISRASRGQSTFAHELGHNLGLVAGGPGGHNPADFTLGTAVGWDVGARLVDNPSTNNVSGRLKPTTFLDRWNPTNNGTTNSAWISQGNYQSLFTAMPPGGSRLLGNHQDAKGEQTSKRPRCVRRLPTISGFVDRYDRRTLLAQRVVRVRTWRSTWCNSLPLTSLSGGRGLRAAAPHAHAAAAGDMSAVVTLQVGSRTRRLTLPLNARTEINLHDNDKPAPSGSSTVALGPFMLQVPVEGTVRELEIRNATGRTVYSKRAAAGGLGLSISGPKDGARLRAPTTLRWRPRTRGASGAVRYVVAYSPDRGATWTPLGSDIKGTSLRVDPARLARSGVGTLRVLATDGLNSASASVGELRVG